MEIDKTDVKKALNLHRVMVSHYMHKVIKDLTIRARNHDKSTDDFTEFELINKYTNEINDNIDDEEIKHTERPLSAIHYKYNDHHPEHFDNDFDDMNLIQLLEFVCDIVAKIDVRTNNNENIDENIKKVHDLLLSKGDQEFLDMDEFDENKLIDTLFDKYDTINYSEQVLIVSLIINTVKYLLNE